MKICLHLMIITHDYLGTSNYYVDYLHNIVPIFPFLFYYYKISICRFGVFLNLPFDQIEFYLEAFRFYNSIEL